MQDSSHLTSILYSSVIKIAISQKFNRKIIAISQKQKFNRKIIIIRFKL
jgi:hypothetical protein